MEKSPNVVNLPLFHLMDVILEILGDSRALTMDDVSLFEDFQSHPLLTAMAFKNIKSMCRRDRTRGKAVILPYSSIMPASDFWSQKDTMLG